MKKFFDTTERLEKLNERTAKWLGTPFVAHAAIRGHGVDCVNLCAEILKECGHITGHFALPRYAIDGGKHNELSQLEAFLETDSRFARAWRLGEHPVQLSPGDVLCMRIGKSAHHAGLFIYGNRFVHCLATRSVMMASLSDPIFKRSLTAVYTPVED